jgi:hypothetical protein
MDNRKQLNTCPWASGVGRSFLMHLVNALPARSRMATVSNHSSCINFTMSNAS